MNIKKFIVYLRKLPSDVEVFVAVSDDWEPLNPKNIHHIEVINNKLFLGDGAEKEDQE